MLDRTVQLTPDEQGLKKATAALIKAVGGQEAAAGFCRYDQRRLSEFMSINTRKFMPIDAVEDLEAVCHGTPGWPQVTAYLASRNRCAVVHLPEAVPTDGGVLQAIARLSKEHADVSAGVCSALAEGVLSAADVRQRDLMREVNEMIEVSVNLLAMLEQAPEGDGR